jgi:hypothetical protein
VSDVSDAQQHKHAVDECAICGERVLLDQTAHLNPTHAGCGGLRARIAELERAVDDLWACLGATEYDHLQPGTAKLAEEIHQRLWHDHPHAQFSQPSPLDTPEQDRGH